MAREWEKVLLRGEEGMENDWEGNQVIVLILLKKKQHKKTSSLVSIFSKFYTFHICSLFRYFSYNFHNL